MNEKRILITGSNGLVGQALINLLLENSNVKIIATSLHENKHPEKDQFQFEIIDITNFSQVDYIIGLYHPDVIIHSAAISQVDFCEENKDTAWSINVDGTKNLINAAKKINAQFIYLSSDFVFDGIKGIYNEEDKTNPISFYGTTKLEAEKIVQNYTGRWAIVRTVLVYGMNYYIGRSNIVTWIVDSCKDGKTINVVDDQFRTPTLDRDLAKGILSIIDKKARGIFHISGSEYLSVYEFAHKIANVFNLDNSLISPISSTSLNQIGKRPAKTGFDISKANRELEFFPLGIIDSLKYLMKNK